MNNISEVNSRVPGFAVAFEKISMIDEYDLSDRECEMLALSLLGYSPSEIALIINREKITVYKHLENIRALLNCKNLLLLGVKLGEALYLVSSGHN